MVISTPALGEYKQTLLDLLPDQGHWSDAEYLWLTDHTSRLVEFTDGEIEVLPPPTDRVHQAPLRRGLPPATAGADGLAPPLAPGRELDAVPDGAQGVLDDAGLVLGTDWQDRTFDLRNAIASGWPGPQGDGDGPVRLHLRRGR